MNGIKQKGLPERAKINLGEPSEVDYWVHELGLSTGELRAVVAKVGTSAHAVRKELALAADASAHA